MIKEDYVNLEIAKLLNIKGFKGEFHKHYWGYEPGKEFLTQGSFNSEYDYPAPTLQTVMKWLREEKGIAVIPIISSVLDFEKFLWDVKIVVAKTGDSYSQGWVYEKQENACEVAIKYCLENLI